MKKIFAYSIFISVLACACGFFVPSPTPVPPTQAATPTAAQLMTATEIPTETPTATATEPPATATPTAQPVIPLSSFLFLPQQWDGITLTYNKDGKIFQNNVTLLIEEVNGNSFAGKATVPAIGLIAPKIYKVTGEFVTDFSADEKKWNYHADYKKGDRNGVWLKLTYLSLMKGGQGDAQVGLWWYAHIVDNKMTGIVFASGANMEPETDAKVEVTLLEPIVPNLPPPSSTAAAVNPSRLIGENQWSGNLIGSDAPAISLVISTMEGDTNFVGQMLWRTLNVLSSVEGTFVPDVASEDEFELIRWNFHQDYRTGNRDGLWIKWTEVRPLKGFTHREGGWFYGHIRSDGTLVGIHFLSKDSVIPTGDEYFLLTPLK